MKKNNKKIHKTHDRFADVILALEDFGDDLSYYIRRFLSRALYNLPRHANGKKRILYMSETLHLWMFPILLLYDEVLLRGFTGTGIWKNLFYPIIFGLAYGLFLNIPTILFKRKINYIISIIAMAVLNLLYIVECIVHRSYFVYMPIGSLLTGAQGVATGYSSEMFSAIFGNIIPILLFLLPVVLYIIFGEKYLPAFQYKWPVVGIDLMISLAFFGIGVLFASTGKTANQYGAQYAFDSASKVFGLPTGLRLSMQRGDNGGTTFVLEEDTAEENVKEEAASEATAASEVTESTETYTVTKEVDFSTEAVEVGNGKNELSLNLDEIIENSKDKTVVALSQYIETLDASDRNDYTGLFEGKNIIVICAEAFTGAVISEEMTPTLYRMQHNGFYFTDYYQPAWGGSTSTGEYSILTGLVPGGSIECMQETQYNNMYFTIGNCMQRLGYSNGAFHNGDYNYYSRQDTHPNLGYGQWVARGNGITDLTGLNWPKDTDLLVDCTALYLDEQPFSLYYMTVNGHSPYTMEDWYLPDSYLEHVLETESREYKENTLVYLGQQYALEVAVTNLISLLEEYGIADNTVIVIAGDHYPYGLEDSSAWDSDENYLLDLFGVDSIDNPWERDKSALIIWSECLENEYAGYACEIDSPTYSLDILPTLLNLFNIDYDSRLLAGRDVFSDTEPLVLWNTGHWITEYGTYNADTYTFTPKEGVEVPDGYVDRINNIVTNKISMSNSILTTDYYGILFGEDTDTSDNRTESLLDTANRLGTNVKDLDESEDTGMSVSD